MYNKQITVNKSIDGGISGVIIGAIVLSVVGFLKIIIDLDPDSEAKISLGLGALLTAILVAAERGLRNWLKHRDLGK